VTSTNSNLKNSKKFEWEVPCIPEDKGVYITASRMQHTPQSYRFWILFQLFKATTFEELAEQLYKLIVEEKSRIPSEEWLKKLLLDKKTGLIKSEEIPSFIRRLKGIRIERDESIVKRKFSKNQIINKIKFYKLRLKSEESENRKNLISFEKALAMFEKNSLTKEIVEVEYIKPAKIYHGKKTISPSDARYILDQVYSLLGRSAGSRLAGYPLTTLHKNIYGIETKTVKNINNEMIIKYVYGNRSGENSFSLSKKRVKIGQPYINRLIEASKLISQVIDAVGRYLDNYVKTQGKIGKSLLSVEKLTKYCLSHLEDWFEEKDTFLYSGIRNRTHQNMDFYFLPNRKIKKKLIEDIKKNNGLISSHFKEILEKETLNGALKLAVVDISGGGGTTGVAEFIAKLLNYKTSGHIDKYIDSLIATFESKNGKKPRSIVICPRTDDLTLASIEYIPVLEAIRKRGLKAYLVLAEQLSKSLHNWKGKGKFTTLAWDGKRIIPELIAKRFTFLGEGQNNSTDRGYIMTKLPSGIEIIPSPSSRIPASNKIINSKILELLKHKLEKLGVIVIPTKIITIVDRTKMEVIGRKLEKTNEKNKERLIKFKEEYIQQGVQKTVKEIFAFAKENKKEWPEIEFLGLVLKLDDKRPGRIGKGGELVSAYPIPARILKANIKLKNKKSQYLGKYRFYLNEILIRRINRLVDKGVYDIIIQPNLLTAFADGEDFMETKLFVYAKLVKGVVNE